MKTKKYIIVGRRWFDRINGNTYHSVEISTTKGEFLVKIPFVYGYGDHYRQTALDWLEANKRIPVKYRGRHENGSSKHWMWERENDYPVIWQVIDVQRKKDL
jgi:hypothetical protein